MMRTKSEQVFAPFVRASKFRKFLKLRQFLLIPMSLIVTLCLIEVPALFNLVDYKKRIGALHDYHATIRQDPELLYIKRPHAHFSGTKPGGDISSVYQLPISDLTMFQWDVKYDQSGFRNEVDLKSADIVAIGDSMVEGISVPTDQLMTSLLARLQNKIVANMGQSAYGPQQELAVLKRYGLPLQPHTVLWVFSEASDLKDIVWYDAAIRNPPNFWQAFYERSFTRTVYRSLKAMAPKPPGVKRVGVIHKANGQTLNMYFLAPAEALSKRDLGAVDETARILSTAHMLCAARRAHLIFVFAPDKFRVFRDFCKFPQESECGNWAVNNMPEHMKKAVATISSEIGYLDLTPYLMDAVKRGEVPYYLDDAHWSPEGHKIAADAINRYITSVE